MKKYTDQGKIDTRSGFGAGLLCFSLSFILSGCSIDIEEQIMSGHNSHQIELDQALTHLDAFLSEYEAQTKSDGAPKRHYSLASVSEVKSSDVLPAATKSSEEVLNLPEDLLYLVNFDDSLGFAVLAADDRLCSNVMCVAESGSLSNEDFADAAGMMSPVVNSVPADSTCVDTIIDMGEAVVPVLLLSSAIGSIASFHEGTTDKLPTKASPPTSTKYGPYVLTKWCQDKINNVNVFNAYTPNNAYAGCTVIAVAQILLSTSVFTYLTNDNYVCYSSDMLTVAPYSNPSSTGSGDAVIQAGKFVYELGSQPSLVHVSYPNIFHSGTSATADDAKRALETFMYTNVVKHLGFNDSKKAIATAQIREGRPVYLGGQPDWTVVNGHAWLLDGEWDPYYHINWGWHGAMDGYYDKGLFDTTQRRLYDSQIDSLTYHYGLKEDHWYTWTYRMVTYSL